MFKGGEAYRLYQSYQGMFVREMVGLIVGAFESEVPRVLGGVFGCWTDDWRCHHQPDRFRPGHDHRGMFGAFHGRPGLNDRFYDRCFIEVPKSCEK